jgi:hypothetical protein
MKTNTAAKATRNYHELICAAACTRKAAEYLATAQEAIDKTATPIWTSREKAAVNKLTERIEMAAAKLRGVADTAWK